MKYDYVKAVEYCNELETFEGYLPCLLRPLPFNNVKYYTNLQKIGLYEEVIEQVEKTRHYSLDEKMDELALWVKDHPKYSDVLVED